MSRRPRSLGPEERALWGKVTESVTPRLKRRAVVAEPDAAALEAVPPARSALTLANPMPSPPSPPKPVPSPAPALVTLERRARRAIVRGHVAIDGRLDLHGMRQEEAHRRLHGFLASMHRRGCTIVLVITGKGGRPRLETGDFHAETGVLRRLLPQWLALPELRRLVIGFEPAHIAHGGEGAFYVRLRRHRGE